MTNTEETRLPLDPGNEGRRWFHKVKRDFLTNIYDTRVIGSPSRRARTVRDVSPGDRIILCTVLSSKPGGGAAPVNRMAFVAVGAVAAIRDEQRTRVVYDLSPRKLQLEDLRFCDPPVCVDRELADRLIFVKNKDKPSDAFHFDYREATEPDFEVILRQGKLVDYLPKPPVPPKAPLEGWPFTQRATLALFRRAMGLAGVAHRGGLIEIRSFVRGVSEFAGCMGMGITYDAAENAYAHNAWKLRWLHEASRDPEVNVMLYDKHGKAYPLGYIRVPGR